jgi:hypothetical protein
VVSTVSKCLNKGLVYGSPLDNVKLKKLPKLKTLSAYAIGPSYPAGIRPILLEIIEAPLKTIETLELVGMEHYISSFSGRSIEGESIFWRYFDSILQDPAFSRLKEIRLLFNCGSTWKSDHSAEICEELLCGYCSIEQTALEFRSSLRQTSGRGVQVTYGLTYGRKGLLSI